MTLKNFAICLLLGVALVAGMIFGSHQNHKSYSSKTVVQLPSGVRISVYQDVGHGDGEIKYDTKKPALFSLSETKALPLSGGVYDFVLSDPDNQYETAVFQETVVADSRRIVISPKYKDDKLATLLPAVRSATLASLYAQYPLMSQNYSLGPDGLYQLGDWYGAVLQPTNPEVDAVRVILHETGGHWKVVAGPAISIGQPSHLDIPFVVVDNIDRLGT